MTIKTKTLGLLQFAQGDGERVYLEKWLALSLRQTDAQFDPVSGHNHNGSGANGPSITGTSSLAVTAPAPLVAGALVLGYSAGAGNGTTATLGPAKGTGFGPTGATMNGWMNFTLNGTQIYLPYWV